MIRIKECGEPLVDVKKYCPDFVIQLDHGQKAFLRKTVVLKLKKARTLLPKGLTFIIRDAWRTPEQQKEIMHEFIIMFRKKNPKWSKERAHQEAKKYVAETSGIFVSGHMTGGAVDLRLWNKKAGKRVPMRSWKLTYQENAEPYQIKLPKYMQRNREVMYRALHSVGFTQCYNEFWHWSYGDSQWAKRVGDKVAKYGVVGGSTLK